MTNAILRGKPDAGNLLCKKLLVAGVAAISAVMAFGGTLYKWKGASGGNWNDAQNWTPSGYPNAAGDVADFSDVTADASVAVPTTVTVGKIIGNLGGTLTIGKFNGKDDVAVGLQLASGTGDQPEISIPNGAILYVACCFKGSQGYNKTGSGQLTQAAYSTLSYTGTSRITAGTVFYNPPTGANTEGRMGDNVEILPGGTLYVTKSDTMGYNQLVHVKGGTYNMTCNDYAGDLTMSAGGLLEGSNWYLPDSRNDGALIETTGTGYAGKISKRLVFTSRYSRQGSTADYRTFIMRIADGTWLNWNFNCSENIDQNWEYANAQFYNQSNQSVYKGTAQIRKEGSGDLYVNNMSTSVSGPTTVIDGRIIFTNTVHWSGSTLVTTKSVNQVAFGKNATVNLSGIDAYPSVGAGTVDLNGATLKLGGFGKNAITPARFTNGTVSKVGPNAQTLTSAQTQKDWKVFGGRLSFGAGKAPCVHFTYDDADDWLKDTGTAGKQMTPHETGIRHVKEGGRSGGYAEFKNGWAESTNALGLPGGKSSFTFSTWIRKQAAQTDFGNGSIIGYGKSSGGQLNNWRFKSGNYCFHSFYGWDMSTSDANKLPADFGDGNWHHYAMTYDSTTRWRSFYVDGVKIVTDTQGADPNVNRADGPFMLGACGGSNSLTGDLDETMIFDVALDDNGILELYSDLPGETRPAKLPTDATLTVGAGASVAFGTTDQTLASLDGVGDLDLEDATVTLAPAAGTTHAIGRLVGNGTLVKNGAGELRIRKGNRLNGTIKLNAGSLTVQGGGLTLAGMSNSIVGYWDFDDPEDMGKDLGPNNMTLKSSFSRFRRSEETAGSAYHNHIGGDAMLTLDDTAKLAKLPKSAEPYTLSAWVKPTTKGTGSIIQWGDMGGNKLNSFRFNNNEGGDGVVGVRHSFYGGDWRTDMLSQDSDFFSDNAPSSWHHLAVSVATDGRKLFLDGVCIATDSAGCSGKNLQQTDFKLGEFKGFLDEAAVFNRALTDEEMKQLPAGFGNLGGLTVDSVAGTAVTVESGIFGLKGGAFAGTLTGAGQVNLSGSLTVSSTTAIAPAKLAVQDGSVIRTAPGVSTSAPISATEQITLPTSLEIVVDLSATSSGKCPIFHSANGFSGSTAGWTVTVVKNGKVRRNAKTEIVMTATDISVSASQCGLFIMVQ